MPGKPYSVLAPYYEQLSETRHWNAWITYVHNVFRTVPGKRPNKILDAACGTGRIAVGLSQLGYNVTGVDVSPAMLTQAKANREQANVTLPLHQGDLRSLNLYNQFDAVICLCDSLNYITSRHDLVRVLQNIKRHLVRGGLFLFDVNTAWKLQNFYGDYTYADHHTDFSYIWQNEYDSYEQTVRMTLSFFIKQEDGSYQRFDEQHVQRAYYHSEIEACLQEAGLELQAWGELNGLTPPEPFAERLFYLVKRPTATRS